MTDLLLSGNEKFGKEKKCIEVYSCLPYNS